MNDLFRYSKQELLKQVELLEAQERVKLAEDMLKMGLLTKTEDYFSVINQGKLPEKVPSIERAIRGYRIVLGTEEVYDDWQIPNGRFTKLIYRDVPQITYFCPQGSKISKKKYENQIKKREK